MATFKWTMYRIGIIGLVLRKRTGRVKRRNGTFSEAEEKREFRRRESEKGMEEGRGRWRYFRESKHPRWKIPCIHEYRENNQHERAVIMRNAAAGVPCKILLNINGLSLSLSRLCRHLVFLTIPPVVPCLHPGTFSVLCLVNIGSRDELRARKFNYYSDFLEQRFTRTWNFDLRLSFRFAKRSDSEMSVKIGKAVVLKLRCPIETSRTRSFSISIRISINRSISESEIQPRFAGFVRLTSLDACMLAAGNNRDTRIDLPIVYRW